MIVDLSEKVIVITGASTGIGAELARTFGREKAKVVINYYHSENEAKELFNEVRSYNSNCFLVKADVANESDVSFMYRKTIAHFGRVDVLINNAGICDDNLLNLMSRNQWQRVIDTNLTGTFLCCREFTKAMIRQNFGKIINIASLKGQVGCVGQVNYAASKAGIIAITKTLAKELGRYNIAVNAVCPGFIVTNLNKNNENKKKIASKSSVFKEEYCIKDLISFIQLLASDNSLGISGRVINVDSRIL